MNLRNNSGQTSAVEYAMTFFLVVAVLVAMTAFVRRVLQARNRDALHYMADTVKADYPGSFYFQYEPYYLNSASLRINDCAAGYCDRVTTGEEGSGIFFREDEKRTFVTSNQGQLSPRYAD